MATTPLSSRHHADSGDQRPDIRDLIEFLHGPIGIRSLALTGIFLFILLYTCYFAQTFLLPVTLAFLFNFLFAPGVRILKRWRVPEPLGALLFIAGFLSVLGYGIYALAGPASEWIQRFPQNLRQAEYKLRKIKEPMKEVGEATRKVEELAGVSQDRQVKVVVAPTLSDIVLSNTQKAVIGGGVTLLLLYFLLASGDLFLGKLVSVLPRLEDKKRAVEIVREIEHDISRYLFTVTVINVGLGMAIGVAMLTLGMPNPVLWGAMAAVLNFIPYLGGAVGMAILTLVASLTFDSVGQILLVPAAYLTLNITEAYLITPAVLGRRLHLNPIVILVWLLFWGWIWGVAGASQSLC